MNLKDSIGQALSVTRKLRDSLDTQDLEQWLALLEKRGQAMEEFERVHRASSRADRNLCQWELAELQREDRDLKHKSEDVLDLLATEFRELRGNYQPAGQQADRDRYQACLDRKA